MSASTLVKLDKNEYATMDILVHTCAIFHRQLSDIVEIIYQENGEV